MKEQIDATYAARLAEKGYVALAFDPSYDKTEYVDRAVDKLGAFFAAHLEQLAAPPPFVRDVSSGCMRLPKYPDGSDTKMEFVVRVLRLVTNRLTAFIDKENIT